MKTLSRLNKGVIAFTLLFGLSSAYAIGVDEIVAKASHAAYYQGTDGKAKVEMQIVDNQGRERNRRFTILRKDIDDANDGRQKFYVYFLSPADVNKTSFLVWKNPGQEDDRWLYLPALDLVKRIAASDERTSFVGSHFFYEDVSGRTPSEDEHTLLEETANYYVLKSTPKNPDQVEFTYYKNWIHKSTFIPVKTEFYNTSNANSKDAPYRTYEALKVENVQDIPTVTQAKMSDDRIGGYTTMSYSKVDYGIGIPEDIFSERYLRSSPRQYLR